MNVIVFSSIGVLIPYWREEMGVTPLQSRCSGRCWVPRIWSDGAACKHLAHPVQSATGHPGGNRAYGGYGPGPGPGSYGSAPYSNPILLCIGVGLPNSDAGHLHSAVVPATAVRYDQQPGLRQPLPGSDPWRSRHSPAHRSDRKLAELLHSGGDSPGRPVNSLGLLRQGAATHPAGGRPTAAGGQPGRRPPTPQGAVGYSRVPDRSGRGPSPPSSRSIQRTP